MRPISKMPVPLLVMLLSVAAVGAAEQPMIDQQAPAFALPVLDGDSLSLEDFRGNFVVLHFGAGW